MSYVVITRYLGCLDQNTKNYENEKYEGKNYEVTVCTVRVHVSFYFKNLKKCIYQWLFYLPIVWDKIQNIIYSLNILFLLAIQATVMVQVFVCIISYSLM